LTQIEKHAKISTMDKSNQTFEPEPVVTKRRLLAVAAGACALVFSMIKIGDALPIPQPQYQIEMDDLTGAELGNAVDGFYLGTNNDVSRSLGARQLSDADANIG
jgi:hypothetical protein